MLNTIAEIKAAVDRGERVICDNGYYEVIKDSQDEYLIYFIDSDYYIGLHGREGTEYANKLNGRDFRVKA